ncbi:hypothetical protein Hanom_Chr06g00508141 [Helianthus anomalus]
MIAYKKFELSIFHPGTGTEITFKKADVVVLDDLTKHKQDLDSGEVALDDVETGATFVDDGIFDAKVAAPVDESDVKSPQDHYVKIVVDVNDPQVHSKDFSIDDTPVSPSVVCNV